MMPDCGLDGWIAILMHCLRAEALSFVGLERRGLKPCPFKTFAQNGRVVDPYCFVSAGFAALGLVAAFGLDSPLILSNSSGTIFFTSSSTR
jgi:hypothetical protein